MWSVCGAVLLSCALATSAEDPSTAKLISSNSTAAPHVDEGCEYIGETILCINGNVTGTILQIECTAGNYPLGENVSIYVHFHPFTFEYNEYNFPLYAGCSFHQWEVAKYTCSFKTDISEFKRGTTFRCVFNQNHSRRQFFEKTDDRQKSSVYRSEVQRPEALLNCRNSMGEPTVAWSISTARGVPETDLFTPGTRLSEFCVLACHDRPTHLDDWELVWTVGDRVVNYTAVSDKRVVNLTLEYNLTSEDEGKILECRLRNRLMNGSFQTLRNMSATLGTKIVLPNDYSIYSDWLLIGVIAALLLSIDALIEVSDGQSGVLGESTEQAGAQVQANPTALAKDVGTNAQDFQIEVIPS